MIVLPVFDNNDIKADGDHPLVPPPRPISRFTIELYRINLADHESSRDVSVGLEGEEIPRYHPLNIYKIVGVRIVPIQNDATYFRPRHWLYFDNCGERGPYISPDGAGCIMYGHSQGIQGIKIDCGTTGDAAQYEARYHGYHGSPEGNLHGFSGFKKSGEWCGHVPGGTHLLTLSLGFYPKQS